MPASRTNDNQQRSRRRSRRRRLLDALVARVLRMPPGDRDYVVTAGLPVPMRDGVTLRADRYAPVGPSQGTVLIRTPYGRASPIAVLTAGYYATHGFQVVNVSCRGTFGSGGQWRPFVAEVADGADTVAWLRTQSWFDGRFALVGASYLGYTAWAIMTDPPPELACAVLAITAHDNHRVTYGEGAFALEGTLTLLDGLPHVEDSFLSGLARFPTAQRRLRAGYQELPLVRAQRTVLAGSQMPYEQWLRAPDADDPVWLPMRLTRALERVEVPVLLHEGWQDRFVDQMIDQYAGLRERGVDVALTIGPWTHTQTATKAARVTMPETLDWLAEHLTGTGRRRRRSPVRIYLTGAEEWRELPAWPPPAELRELFLQPGGGLAALAPDPTAVASTFRYDPADPTPALGGRVINQAIGGRRDNRRLEQRADVLTFTSAPLPEALDVVGTPEAVLAHGSDNPYADLFVRLCEVSEGGRSLNLSDGFRRLVPDPSAPATGGTVDTVVIAMEAIAHRFPAGSRIRLQVSGGAHPRWARNLGTGEDPATGTTLRESRRTIGHGADGISLLRLPCPVPASPELRTADPARVDRSR